MARSSSSSTPPLRDGSGGTRVLTGRTDQGAATQPLNGRQALAAGLRRIRRELPGYLRIGWAAVLARPPIVTLVFIICIIATFIRLQVNLQLPVLGYLTGAYSPRALKEGHLHLIATSTLLTNNIFMLVSISYSLLFALGALEVVAGHLRALLMIVFAAVIGPILVSLGLGVLIAFGSTWADGRLETLDIGASAIIACASGAVAGIARNRWFTIGLVLFLIGGLIVHHRIADWEHVLIFPCGYGFGRVLGRARPRSTPPGRRVATSAIAAAVLLGFGLIGSAHVLPTPAVSRGPDGTALSAAAVVDTTYPSPALGGSARRVLVLLPAGYSSHTRYPVIELLHGHPGRPDGLLSVGGVVKSMAAAGVGPFIAVIPDGNGPRHDDSWFANIPSQQMGTSVTTDLRRWVARHYRITPDWSYAGLSSGGFAAAYLPLVDSQPVHAVCGLSGYYTGARVPLSAKTPLSVRNQYAPIKHLSSEPNLTFLAYGRGDRITKGQTVAYERALRKAGMRVLVRTYPGTHEWSVWRPAFRDCFRLVAPAAATRP
ncbi:MAG: alpha/beta hydrolase-fold protein [Jatrophihabitans sp.]